MAGVGSLPLRSSMVAWHVPFWKTVRKVRQQVLSQAVGSFRDNLSLDGLMSMSMGMGGFDDVGAGV